MKKFRFLKILIFITVIISICFYSLLTCRDEEGSAKPKDTVSFSFVGDILLSSNVETMINRTSSYHPFANVRDNFSNSDFVFGNLENPISDKGDILVKKTFNFRANPKVLDGLKWSGINVLSIANNHILDYGYEAMHDTIGNLSKNGFYCTGAGINEEDALKPIILEKNGKKIAFISASRVITSSAQYARENSAGIAQAYNPKMLLEKVNEIDSQVDIVVVYMHWGKEKSTVPNKIQTNLAKSLIDNGADIVVGSHPHVLQGFEFYKGGLIAYSLGNFVFTDYNRESIILNVEVNRDNTYTASIVPCIIKNYRPEPVFDVDGKINFYNKMKSRSFDLDISNGVLIPKNQ